MKYVLAAIASIAAAYQIVAITACLWHLHRRRSSPTASLGVSILKPIHGLHPGFDEALRSHAEQQFPKFELLLGYVDPGDPALAEIARAIGKFPGIDIRAVQCTRQAPNRKAGVLMDLVKEARYPLLIVNDADIVVPPNYLRDVTAPLTDPAIGLVTCVYRAEGNSWPSRFEALGVATDFAPSTLVAPFVGVSEFGLGSTLAFRHADLDRIGGFTAVADYLADDYQLGFKLHGLGLRNIISQTVVSTRLHGETWHDVWRHQLRWARTIRLSRRGGYAGLPITFAFVWAVAAACAGLWWLAAFLAAIRFAMAFTAGWLVLRCPDVLKLFWLIPLRDLYAAAVWLVALFGTTVEWSGETLQLDRHGRITSIRDSSKGD